MDYVCLFECDYRWNCWDNQLVESIMSDELLLHQLWLWASMNNRLV